MDSDFRAEVYRRYERDTCGAGCEILEMAIAEAADEALTRQAGDMARIEGSHAHWVVAQAGHALATLSLSWPIAVVYLRGDAPSTTALPKGQLLECTTWWTRTCDCGRMVNNADCGRKVCPGTAVPVVCHATAVAGFLSTST